MYLQYGQDICQETKQQIVQILIRQAPSGSWLIWIYTTCPWQMADCRYLFPAFLIYTTFILTSSRATAELPGDQDNILSQMQLLQTLKDTNPDLTGLEDTISKIDDDLSGFQKRTCSFGLSGRHCALSNIDSYMSAGNWLNSGHSPGKRSHTVTSPVLRQKYERVLEDIARRRERLAELKTILSEDDSNRMKRKRTCSMELGGQCATEFASALADQYYYLNSHHSPGRRRRRSAGTSSTANRRVADADIHV